MSMGDNKEVSPKLQLRYGSWNTVRFRHLGLGFFWACSMLTFRSTFLLAESIITPETETFVVIVSFAVNAALLLGVSSLIEKNPKLYDKLPALLFVLFIISGLLFLHLAGFFPDWLWLPFLLIGSVATGLGYGYFWGSWAQVLGRIHPSRNTLYMPLNFLCTTLLFIGVSFAKEVLGLPILVFMIPLPLISFICLKRCQTEENLAPIAARDNKRYLQSFGSLWGLILASLVLSCLFGIVWEMTVLSVGSVNQAHQVPLIINFVTALAILGFVVFAKTRIDLSLAYQIIVPVIVVAFLIMPMLWETNPILINAIVSASYGVFDVIIWYMVVSTAFDFSLSGFVIGGVVRAVSVISRLLGIGIGYVVVKASDEMGISIFVVSLGSIYILAMLFLLYRRRKGLMGSKSILAAAEDTQIDTNIDMPKNITPEASPAITENLRIDEDAAQEKIDARHKQIYSYIAEEYALTRREAEILPYLVKGRTAKIIAQTLYVSESTIRTHTRKILEKTDLHSKQELIDLIEGYE